MSVKKRAPSAKLRFLMYGWGETWLSTAVSIINTYFFLSFTCPRKSGPSPRPSLLISPTASNRGRLSAQMSSPNGLLAVVRMVRMSSPVYRIKPGTHLFPEPDVTSLGGPGLWPRWPFRKTGVPFYYRSLWYLPLARRPLERLPGAEPDFKLRPWCATPRGHLCYL